MITRFALAPANVSELAMVTELAAQIAGWLVGDRNYLKPTLAAALPQAGLALLAPFRLTTHDPHRDFAALVSHLCYWIDTVFGQLVEHCSVKHVWVWDSWHLWSQLLHKVLMHTLAVLFNRQQGHPPLRSARIVS